jgi:hypothetical protein
MLHAENRWKGIGLEEHMWDIEIAPEFILHLHC